MAVPRRSVLKGLAAGSAAVAAGGLSLFPRRAVAAAEPVAPAGTTLDTTVRRGPAINPQGYVRLVSGTGEPHVVRSDLGAAAKAGREGRRRNVLAFAHLTDIHVIDAESPARVEWLDRYNDGPGSSLIFGSAYRPQELLTTQLADSIVSAVEEVGRGPLLGAPLAFAVCTGDNTDNCQLNELRWQMGILDGTPIRPDSGSLTAWEGVHDNEPTSYDTHYWHPEGPQGDQAPDQAIATYGFPVVPGLLDAARRPFTPRGLSIPWYTCYGNHDGLVQGNFPRSFQFSTVATGPVKITSLPAGASPDDVARGLTAGDPAVLATLATAPTRVVTADPARRVISRAETVKEHFQTGGLPVGHGYTAENVSKGTAYYSFDPAPLVRGIVLDTVNPNGESSGSIDSTQLAWLRAQLQAATGPGRNRLVILFSHHTIDTMTNSIPVVDEPGERVLGPEVRDLLLQFPNVIAWVNGHTHVNQVTAHRRATGGGFWEVNTAAHVDFPSQARILELVDNRDGTLSIFATVVDADAPLTNGGQISSTRALAALARELAANDWQERSEARRGKVEDRNVELLVAAPFPLTAAAAPAAPPTAAPEPTPRPRPEPPSLPATGADERVGVLAAAATAAAAVGIRWARAGEDPPRP